MQTNFSDSIFKKKRKILKAKRSFISIKILSIFLYYIKQKNSETMNNIITNIKKHHDNIEN